VPLEQCGLVRARRHATPGQGHYSQHKANKQDAKGRVNVLEEGNEGLDKVQLSQDEGSGVSGGRRAIAVAASQFLMQKAREDLASGWPRRFLFVRWAFCV